MPLLSNPGGESAPSEPHHCVPHSPHHHEEPFFAASFDQVQIFCGIYTAALLSCIIHLMLKQHTAALSIPMNQVPDGGPACSLASVTHTGAREEPPPATAPRDEGTPP